MTITYSAGTTSISTTDSALVGTTISLYLVAFLQSQTNSLCAQIYTMAKITIKKPSIVTTTVANMFYTIGEAAVSQTFTAFSNDLGITGDPKLVVQYSLYYASGVSWTGFTGVVSSFSGTTITAYTTSTALPVTNNMKLYAVFSYNPTATPVELDFTITIAQCFTATITKAPQSDMLY